MIIAGDVKSPVKIRHMIGDVMYDKFVKICKRVNNNKRNFLVLNEAQCKHVPSSPMQALEMFVELGKLLEEYRGERGLVVVGFAETATALGASVATYLGCPYISTTREDFESDLIEFSEDHSHASEQRLVRFNVKQYSHVIFVDDEVTTGNTIEHIMNVLKQTNHSLKVTIASLLNGMSATQLEVWNYRNVDVHFLVALDKSKFTQIADDIVADGHITDLYQLMPDSIEHYVLDDTRKLTDMDLYNSELDAICELICNETTQENICVLGTEECMYPAIILGAFLEEAGKTVVCHSTTRSPIGVVSEETDPEYPLNSGFKLPSCYNRERETYLYNVGRYDKVYIVTDADHDSVGIMQLVLALRIAGNNSITLIHLERW